jgi:tetrahydromethanopterin S-methyltransferase subunit B
MEARGGLVYRMEQLEAAVRHLDATVQEQAKALARLEPLSDEVKSLRKAAYWVAGIIVASSIGFAFGVLALL